MGAPVFQEPLGFRRDLPVSGIGQAAPAVDLGAELVDYVRGLLVLLLRGGESRASVQREALLRFAFLLARLWDGRNEFGFTVGWPELSSSQPLEKP